MNKMWSKIDNLNTLVHGTSPFNCSRRKERINTAVQRLVFLVYFSSYAIGMFCSKIRIDSLFIKLVLEHCEAGPLRMYCSHSCRKETSTHVVY